MDEFFKNCCDSHTTVCVYFSVVLVLLLLCVYQLSKLPKAKEHYTGVGLGHSGGYNGATSGATVRTLGQEFSGTNQEDRSIISNAEISQLDPDLSRVGRAVDIFANSHHGERLVNERGEPDFWEISSELAAYKASQSDPMRQDAAAKAEQFRGHREQLTGKIGSYQDDQLGNLLNR